MADEPPPGTFYYEMARLREAQRALWEAFLASPPGRLVYRSTEWLAAMLSRWTRES